jgi:tetratricopeptide (TPR) repeat protein
LNTAIRNLFFNQYVRLILVVLAVGFCLWTIKTAAYFGVSRLFTRSALALQNLTAAQTAVRLTPTDAQAYRANAALLSRMDATAESVSAIEQAITLRPEDYSLWLALGLLRDKMGDTTKSLAALDEAIEHAPFYAHPRWQRGNVLLRSGQYEAAFRDLNQAAQSNPELVPNIIDLAWNITKGDPHLTEELVEIKNDKARLAFARFLADHGRPVEAMQQSRMAGRVDENARRELVKQLLDKRAFTEAFQVWAQSEGSARTNVISTIYDGGFEATLSTNEIGFGWRVPVNGNGLNLSVDPNQPHSGSKSLRIDFDGDSPPTAGLLSQLILVQPSTRYRINFAGRSREIITGGRPLAVVIDASEKGGDLGQSAPLDKGTSDWRPFSIEFTSTPETRAVFLGVRREQCPTSPCPIFGSIGLDSFSIEQLR